MLDKSIGSVLNGTAMQLTFVAIEIGGTKLQTVLGSSDGKILRRKRMNVDASAGGEGIRKQIEAALPDLIDHSKPAAIGVGFGGPVDWRTGRICRSHHVEGWNDFSLAAWLRERTVLPVFVDNDANVAALGEAHHGAGRGCDPVFYVTLGSGVGGGLVMNGRIYHGAIPGEAEIGHVRLDRTGATVESRCSGWAIDRRIRERIATNKSSMLARLTAGATSGEAKFLAPALNEGDSLAKEIVNEAAEDLAFGLSHAVHLFHPEVIVLGGGLSLVGEQLRSAVASNLRGFIMDAFAPGPAVRLAALGEDAVPAGALVLAAQRSGQTSTE